MAQTKFRFDPYLQRINADKLKKMVRMWGGTGKLRKDECIAVIQSGLSDLAKVRAAVQSLDPWEQNSLAILKTFGNEIESEVLHIAIRATATPLPPRMSKTGWNDQGAVIAALFSRGLILSGGYSPDYFSGYGSARVFTDDRLTAAAAPLEVQPFEIEPMPPPQHTVYRRPPTVALDVIGLLQAISDLGGLRLTKAGELRVAAVNKLRKALKWDEKGIKIEGLFFPDPAMAWISALRHSDLLVPGNDSLTLGEPPEHFAARPYGKQIRLLLDGFLRSVSWSEISGSRSFSFRKNYYLGRQALVIGLQSLPQDVPGFFSIDNFERALFDRIGEYFSLGYVPRRPTYFHGKSEAQKQQEIDAWQTKLRDNWLAQERPWIDAALKTWGYFLGMVELALDDDSIIGFRLTSLGREVLHPELTTKHQDSAAHPNFEGAAWVVQPNFEVIAYLDRISAIQLAFLERFAERHQVNQHTALFRLNQNSVYRGLESGSTLDELLQGLERGADAGLPQNVVVELREWAALREKITLYHRASLLEFSDEKALQAACQAGLMGIVVGERYLILEEVTSKSEFQRRDYALALPSCLTISEQGKVRIQAGYSDLWIAAQLDQWAEPVSDGWQLTAESIATALRSGKRLADLLNLLTSRSKKSIPKLLRVALHTWSGENLNVELDGVLLLRCRDDEVFQALAASQQLRPYLKGRLDRNILLINKEDFEKVTNILHWARIQIADQIEVIAL